MAQANKSTHIVDIKVQKQDVEKLLTLLQEIGQTQKLNNTNGNTFNAILKEVGQVQQRLKPLKPGSKTDIKTLEDIDKLYAKILQHLNTIILSEKSLGETTSDYNKRLNEASETLQKMRKNAENLKQSLASPLVSPEGKVKKSNQKAVMESAVQSSRQGRRGANTAAEKLLIESNNIGEIQKLVGSEDPKIAKTAAEAIKLYNSEVQRLAQTAQETRDELAALNDEILIQRQTVSDIESTPSGYDPQTVGGLETYRTTLENTLQVNEQYRKSLADRGETEVSLGEKVDINSGIFNKAATSLFNYSILYRILQNLMRQAVQTVIQMDDAITGLSVVTGKSREELQALIPQFKQLAQNTSSTITEVAGLTEEYVKQGRTLKDAMTLAEQTAKAAKIAGISVSDSIQYMTSAINGFNLAAKDAEHVSDVFAKLAAESATDYESLAVALSKVSAQANTAGMSIEYTTALLAKGIETTQEAPESIGTALKTIVARMREITDYSDSLDASTPINKVEKALKSAGVSLRSTTGQFRSLEEVFNELGPKWDNLNTMQQQAIAQAVAGTRQQSRFLAIMQDWDRTVELTSSATDAAGESQYQYNQVAQSLSASITRLTTAWQSFISGLVDNDAIKGLLDTATGVLNIFNSIAETMNSWGNDSGILGTATTLGTILTIVSGIIQKIRSAYDERMQMMHKQIELLDKIKSQNESEEEQQERQNELQRKENEIMSERLNIFDKLIYKKDAYYNKLDKDNQAYQHDQRQFKSWEKQWTEKRKQQKEEKKNKNTLFNIDKKATKEQTKNVKAKEKGNKKQKESKQLSEKELKIYSEELKKRQESLKAEQESLKASISAHETRKQELTAQLEKVKGTEQEALVQAQINTETQALTAENERQAEVQQAVNKLEEAQTQQEGQQVTYEQAQATLKASQTAQNATQISQESTLLGLIGKRVGQELKAFAFKVGQAMTSFVTMALAGLAIGAVTSLIGAVGGAISTAANPGSADRIRENQDAINENKKKSSSLTSLRDEYQELYIKQQAGTLSQEEHERMDEIIAEVQEIDDNITGTGQVLIESISEAIKATDEKTAKLIKENYANLKLNRGGLSASEASLTASQYAELATKTRMQDSDLTTEQQQLALDATAQIVAGFDYDKYVEVLENNSGWDEFWGTKDAEQAAKMGKELDKLIDNANQLSIDMSKALTSTENSLFHQVEAYRNALSRATTDSEREAIEGAYSTIAAISGLKDDVLIGLEKTIDNQVVMTSGQILEFTSTLLSLGIGAGTVESALDSLYRNMTSSAEGLTVAAAKLATYKEMLNWTDEQWKEAYLGDSSGEERTVREQEWDRMIKSGDIKGYKNKVLETTANTLSGFDVSQTRERTQTHASQVAEINDIIDLLLDDGQLSTEQLDLLAGEYTELMSNEEFVKALTSAPRNAALQLLKEVDSTVQGYIKSYEVSQGTILARINSLVEQIAQTTDENELQALKQDLEVAKSEYNANQIAIEQLAKHTVEMLDVFEETMNNYDFILEQMQNQLDDGTGNLNIIKNIASLSAEKLSLVSKNINDTIGKMAEDAGLSKEDLLDYFDIVNGKLIPKAEELNKNSDLRRLWLLNKDKMESYYEVYDEESKRIKDLQQQAIDDAISNQEFYLEYMTTAYEKEAEALKESLEERQEMYDKYFDALEGEEETQNYENDREALINRIAKLSSATDSESLKQLKEAQQELDDLNKEYNSSQREARRDAVSTRLENASENIDKKVEEILSDTQGLWEEWLRKQETMDQESQLDWLESLGAFEGMTDLMIQNFKMNDWLDNAATLDSYKNVGYSFDNITKAILEGIKQAPVTTTTENGDAINNSVTTTIENIIIGENTSYSADEIKRLVQSAFEDSWEQIVNQYGYALNRKE